MIWWWLQHHILKYYQCGDKWVVVEYEPHFNVSRHSNRPWIKSNEWSKYEKMRYTVDKDKFQHAVYCLPFTWKRCLSMKTTKFPILIWNICTLHMIYSFSWLWEMCIFYSSFIQLISLLNMVFEPPILLSADRWRDEIQTRIW